MSDEQDEQAVAQLSSVLSATPKASVFDGTKAKSCSAVRTVLSTSIGMDGGLDPADFVTFVRHVRNRLDKASRSTPPYSDASSALSAGVLKEAHSFSLALRTEGDDDESIGRRFDYAASILDRSRDIYRPADGGRRERLATTYLRALIAFFPGWWFGRNSDPALHRLAGLAESYCLEIISAGALGGTSSELTNYVRRDRENGIMRALTVDYGKPVLIYGEAGSGKSCLAASIYSQLAQGGQCLLISASWFLGRNGHGSLTSDAITIVALHPAQLTILIDTADVLLRSEEEYDMLQDIVRSWSDCHRVAVVSRPREAHALPLDKYQGFELTDYSDREVDEAARVLSRKYAPDSDPNHAAATLRTAMARGMLVPPIYRRPLLLRMLFELSAPDFPTLDVDINDLYERFWQCRIVRDARIVTSRRAHFEPAERDRDLGDTASRVAIRMLANGELNLHVGAVAASIGAVETDRTSRGVTESERDISSLIMRDVLQEFDDHLRFFHQTVFEFIAARALQSRSARGEFIRLSHYLSEHPNDLFVGAVFEQLATMIARDPGTHVEIGPTIAALFGSDVNTIQDIAVRILASNPDLIAASGIDILRADVAALKTFCRNVIAYRRHDPVVAIRSLVALVHLKHLHQPSLSALTHMARRFPEEVVSELGKEEAIRRLLAANPHFVSSDDGILPLLIPLVSHNSDFVRRAILECLRTITQIGSGRSGVRAYLLFVSERWRLLGSSWFLVEIGKILGGGSGVDDDSRNVRRWLGNIYAANLAVACEDDYHASTVRAFAEEACRLLEIRDTDILAGAQISAVCELLAAETLSLNDEAWVISRLFALEGSRSPYQLARGPLALVLSADCRARSTIVEILARRLSGVGIGERNVPDWGHVARGCLQSAEIPASVFVSIVQKARINEPTRWLKRGAVLILTPRSAALQVPAARDALNLILDDSGLLEDEDADIFIDGAKSVIAHSEIVMRVFLVLASRRRRVATISEVVATMRKNGTGIEMLHVHRKLLNDIIKQSLAEDQSQQERGARLWGILTEVGVTTPTPNELIVAINKTTRSTARARLVDILGDVARHNADGRAAVIGFCLARLQVTTHPQPGSVETKVVKPAMLPDEVDSIRRAWLLQLAFGEPDPCLVSTIATLTLAPWHRNKAVPFTPERVGDANRAIALLAQSGYVAEAWDLFQIIAMSIVDPVYKPKQQKAAANMLGYAMHSVCSASTQRQVVENLAILPRIADAVAAEFFEKLAKSHWSLVESMDENIIISLGPQTRGAINSQRRQRNFQSPGGHLRFLLRGLHDE